MGREEELQEQVEDLQREVKTLRETNMEPLHWLGLTSRQEQVLRLLASQRFTTREKLYDHLYWNRHDPPQFKTLDVHVSHLRRKLRKLSGLNPIETVWGRGYNLTPEFKAWFDETVTRRASESNSG